MPLGPIAAAVLPSVIGGIADIFGQQSANAANARLAQKQMDFQERMSNTQWQRGVKDMQAAGINPMLSVSQGPASAPQGAMARMESVTGGRMSERAINTVMSVAQVKSLTAQANSANASARLQNADAAIKEASVPWSAQNAENQAKILNAQFEKVDQEVINLVSQNVNLENDRQRARFELDVMNPLKQAYQEYLNETAKANIPQAQADAAFWSKIQEEGGITAKVLLFLKQLVK